VNKNNQRRVRGFVSLWDTATSAVIKTLEINIPENHCLRNLQMKDGILATMSQIKPSEDDDNDKVEADGLELILWKIEDSSKVLEIVRPSKSSSHVTLDFNLDKNLIAVTCSNPNTGKCQVEIINTGTQQTILCLHKPRTNRQDSRIKERKMSHRRDKVYLLFSQDESKENYFLIWQRKHSVGIWKISRNNNIVKFYQKETYERGRRERESVQEGYMSCGFPFEHQPDGTVKYTTYTYEFSEQVCAQLISVHRLHFDSPGTRGRKHAMFVGEQKMCVTKSDGTETAKPCTDRILGFGSGFSLVSWSDRYDVLFDPDLHYEVFGDLDPEKDEELWMERFRNSDDPTITDYYKITLTEDQCFRALFAGVKVGAGARPPGEYAFTT